MSLVSPPTPLRGMEPGLIEDAPSQQSPAPAAPPRSRLRRVLRAAAWAALAIGVITLGVFAFLGTAPGRELATHVAESIMNSRIRGVSHIGAITRLDFDGVEMIHLTVTAPDGEQVISADRMSAEFAFVESFRRGAIVMTPCELEGGTMVVSRGPADQINLVYTMEVPDDRFMIPVQIRDIRMLHQTMVFHLPPLPVSIEMANVYGLIDMEVGHQFTARLDQVHGYVNIPVVHIGFLQLNGRIMSDDARPLIVRMRMELEVTEPTMRITYSAPGAIGRDGGGNMSIELGNDMPDPNHVGQHAAHGDG